jgi:hypothetical protein
LFFVHCSLLLLRILTIAGKCKLGFILMNVQQVVCRICFVDAGARAQMAMRVVCQRCALFVEPSFVRRVTAVRRTTMTESPLAQLQLMPILVAQAPAYSSGKTVCSHLSVFCFE